MGSSGTRRKIGMNVAAGLIGGLVAAWTMEEFQGLLAKMTTDVRRAPGGGGQQHREAESEPATAKAADAVAVAVTGHHLDADEKAAGGELVHYAFGGAVGAIYGALAASARGVTVWGGAPFGAAVWLVADEAGVPLAGLSKRPTEYSATTHASALAAHLVYGTTTEGVRRLLTWAMRT